MELSEQEVIRRQSLDSLRTMGIEPYPAALYPTNNFSIDIKSNFKDDEKPVDVCIAGRIMSRRIMGKASFIELQDSKGRIQVYISRDDINTEEQPEMYNTVFKKLLDIGDFIGVKGFVFRTQMGEISVHCKELTVLSKSLRPLPIVKYKDGVAYDSFDDAEMRYRQRYVDLVVNEGVKDIFLKRSRVYKSMREYFNSFDYVEVETPILQPIPGGASARPFITHHNALNREYYLRIATELPLKKLIVGGFDKVFELGRIFRNEGMDATHNPEFTTMEAYSAFESLDDMMTLSEQLYQHIAKSLNKTTIEYKGVTIDFTKPFNRISMIDCIKNACGVDFNNIKTNEEAIALAKEHNITLEKHEQTLGHVISKFFEEYGEATCMQPTFVYDHPIEISPLAKKCQNNKNITRRFELFICGKEYANAFSELNDPIDQYERFEEQLKERELGNSEANDMDMDFIEALEYGLPPTGGVGYGIDRLCMLFTNKETIRDVLLFPHMKDETNNNE